MCFPATFSGNLCRKFFLEAHFKKCNRRIIKPHLEYIDHVFAGCNITLKVNEYDLKHLPSGQIFICLANSLIPGIDELVLIKLLTPLFSSLKLLNNPGQYFDPLLSRYYLQTDKQEIAPRASTFLNADLTQIKSDSPGTCVLACVLDLWGSRHSPFKQLKRLKKLNKLIKSIRKTALPIIPIHIDTRKTDAGNKIHGEIPVPATLVVVRIGSVISPDEQMTLKSPSHLRKLIQSKIFTLGSSLEVQPFYTDSEEPNSTKEEISEPVDPGLMEQEINSLKPHNLIVSRANFDVFIARATAIPIILNEIGRLREITFREVGEGTGKKLDLDEFDLYYQQLFIWDKAEKKIVGGYRLGQGDEIFKKYGVEGFYINSLFKIKKELYPSCSNP